MRSNWEMESGEWGPFTKQKSISKEVCVLEEVRKVIDEIRPSLKADGGDVELVEVTEDGMVKLKLLGACGHCPMSIMTLKMGIERTLKERVAGIKEVIAI